MSFNNFLLIPTAYGAYRLLKWLASKVYPTIAILILWKKRVRLGEFVDNIMRRLEHGY